MAPATLLILRCGEAAVAPALTMALARSGVASVTEREAPAEDPLSALGDPGEAPSPALLLPDEHPAALAKLLDQAFDLPLPIYGERTRALAWQALGPAATMAPLTAGLIGGRPIFLLPPDAETAILAWTEVIAPLCLALGATPKLAAATPRAAAPVGSTLPPPPPTARAAAATGHVSVEEIGAPEPEAGDPEAPPAPGWLSGLAALGGTIDRDRWPTLPELYDRAAAAREVLDGAGDRATLVLPSGERLSLFGFPDLRRSGSKVLAVAEGDPLSEILALHRHPRAVGLLREGGSDRLPSAGADPRPEAEARTGRPCLPGGSLFALEGAQVYIQRGGKVWAWDGRREVDMGSPKQAMASLVLRWSQQ